MTDRWAWWQNALAGKMGRITTTPEQGFYRCRWKDQPWQAVAIWFDDESGKWMGMRGNEQVLDVESLWLSSCRSPVAEAVYDQAMAGGGFIDEPERTATAGHNLPSDLDPHEKLRIEYLGEAEMAEEFLKAPIKTRDDASKAAIWSKRLGEIARKATDLHKVEKQPSLDEGRRIDERWRELKESPKALSIKLKRHSDDYLLEQERIERERQRLAREEAERIRREAEAAALAARHADICEDDDIAAARQAEVDRLQQTADRAEVEAQERRVQIGRTGAKLSLRTFVSARITNFDALLTALKNRPEIRDVVQSLANRAAKSGVNLPGMEIVEERKSV